MSTATETQPVFGEVAARALPALACIGKVVKVEVPTETKGGEDGTGVKYLMYNIHLEGYGAGRKARVNLMIRPEWLHQSFNPSSFAEIEGGSSMEFLYAKAIAQRGQISILQGLVGVSKADDPRWGAFCSALMSANGEPMEIHAVLQDWLIEQENGNFVGYILKQQREKAGFDEDGKQLYTPTQYYEVNGFFEPNEKGRKAQYDRADRTAGGTADRTFKVQFTEDDVPA